MERRDFLCTAAVGAGMAAASGSQTPPKPNTLPIGPPPETVKGDMRYRKLAGEDVSVLGIGGHHIGQIKDEAESIRVMRSAIDAGVTFMDNCWDYHDGLSELRMGKALSDGYRRKVYLMTKIDGRTKKEAAKQIDTCLKRLETDCIDLVQHHEIIRMEDGDRIFAKDAAHEAMVEAKKAGKLRHMGFTGHKDPLVHLRMLEIADRNQFHFDSVQMPVNVMDAHFRSFTREVLPKLVEKKIAALAMKTSASGAIIKSGTATAVECLQFALSLPITVAIRGIDSMAILKQDLEAVKSFKPLTAPQVDALLAKTAEAAKRGEFERFKTSSQFDGTAKHPEWLGEPEGEP